MRQAIPFICAVVLLAGCADSVSRARLTPVQPSRDDCELSCTDPGTYLPGTSTWQFFGMPPDNSEYEAPNDPSPGTPGLWLGATVTASTCFNDRTRNIVDNDHDWLDDRCELEIARGFAPRWDMGYEDHCPGGEPVWAAKYFPNENIVRVMYMPAYYKDCGPDGHTGDSEFAFIDVRFNAVTQHWEFVEEGLTAHYGVTIPFIDRSQLVDASGAEFPFRYLGHPSVAVAVDKHGNFSTGSKCNNAFVIGLFETGCTGGLPLPFRFPIDPARNAGSRFQDFLGCIPSTNSALAANGRLECFYQSLPFNGWQPGGSGATPYSTYLNRDFENYVVTDQPLTLDPGPGPAPAVLVRVQIVGPTQITTAGTYTWTASASNCNPSCTYRWRRSDVNGAFYTVSYASSVSIDYTSLTPTPITLELTAYTDPNESAVTTRTIFSGIAGGTSTGCGFKIRC